MSNLAKQVHYTMHDCDSVFNIVIVPILTESDSSISANPSTTCVVKPEGMQYIKTES